MDNKRFRRPANQLEVIVNVKKLAKTTELGLTNFLEILYSLRPIDSICINCRRKMLNGRK